MPASMAENSNNYRSEMQVFVQVSSRENLIRYKVADARWTVVPNNLNVPFRNVWHLLLCC